MCFDLARCLDLTEKIFRVLAYFVGGAWVYFNFFKGRTYRPRLELHLEAHLARRIDPELITAVVRAKNVGLGKVDIRKEGTAVRILAFDAAATDSWRHLATIGIFERHHWIEPGETIEDHVVHSVPLANVAAVKIEAIAVSTKTMWETTTIVV